MRHHARVAADTAQGEFRVPDDTDTAVVDAVPGDADTDTDAARDDTRAAARARRRDDLADVDTSRTPGTMVAAVAFGIVAAPLLAVYAVLFLSRSFLRPGVEPDITGSWTGEGISGGVAAVLALVLLVIVARAAGGRALPVFLGAQVVVLAGAVYLLLDDDAGGRQVSVAVAVVAVAALVCALLPTSRRWFAAHAARRAEDR